MTKASFQTLLLLALFILLNISGFAQTKIEGIAIDTAHNNVLRSATVSVYEKGNKSVDKITLTDTYGKFTINDLGFNKTYLLELRYQGFKKALLEFILKKDESKNFGKIHMDFVENELEEVEVLPPVRMNGDTLEFNADAFKLDSNAVVEDLLRKLPGIVVWGDGSLTYNGKEIPNILVNGKEFFGSSKAIVLQNLAKDAVQKLQIYDKRDEKEKKENPHNVALEMNVTLKKGKEKMYFGSLSYGRGTSERYQQHANFNLSTGKSQYTLAYSGNNSNKYLQSTDHLLKNTSFKGVGINADFDSDFLSTGINNQHVLSGRYQYDIVGTNQVNRKHLLTSNVLSRWDNTVNKDHSTTSFLSDDNAVNNQRTNDNESHNKRRSLIAALNYTNTGGKVSNRFTNLTADADFEHSSNLDNSVIRNEYNYTNEHAQNTVQNNGEYRKNRLSYNTNIDLYDVNSSPTMSVRTKNRNSFGELLSYKLKWSGSASETQQFNEMRSAYMNADKPELNRQDHRTYDKSLKEFSQNINLSVRYLDWTFANNLSFYHTTTNDNVVNLVADQSQVNLDLTHLSRFNQLQYEPNLEKSFRLKSHYLQGRSSSFMSLILGAGLRFYKAENRSTLGYRNLEQTFTTFLPQVRLSRYYSKSSQYNINSSLTLNYDEEYPNLDQLRPIYDNSNVAYRFFGATQLKKTQRAKATFMTSFNEQRQNGYSGNISLSYTQYRQGLTDSILFKEGQQQRYLVQIATPMPLLAVNGYLNKNYPLSKTQALNFQFDVSLNWGNKIQFIDAIKQEMGTNSQNISLKSYYTILDRYQIGWINGLNRYARHNKLSEKNNDYISNYWTSGLSMSYSLSKRWQLNSNGTSRLSSANNYKDHAFIWNMNTTYRLLPGNNLELKLSAYDLLKENKGLYINNGLTEFTQGYRNNLTQYFMLSFTYFPRKFGFK
jgi:hypothetical protein